MTAALQVDPAILRAELLHVIGEAIADRPRSQQKKIGPSEIGGSCDRRLGHKLLDNPPVNRQPPGWRAQVGVAVHAWLEDVFDAWNITNGHLEDPRWLVEVRLPVGQINGEDVDGTCDLFDTATGTAVDWKVPGPTTMRNVKAGRFDPAYGVQRQLYGRGWELRGHQVNTVANMYLPAAGELADAVFDAEPYDRAVAEQALARVSRIQTIVSGLGARALPVLPTADAHCGHCPWFKPNATDLTVACPGAEDRTVRVDSVTALIA